MTTSPVCCVPGTPIVELAVLLADHDCGAIPVIENVVSGRPVGMVTDRDIVCRIVAAGRNVATLTASDAMTAPCITAAVDMSLEECVRLMEGNRIRRIVVVDDAGAVSGIVAQADVALKAEESTVAAVLKSVSEPAESPSKVGS
ncbi:MAG: CBS domain-containing protein [Syntrophomonadaceae bacterium]